MSVTLITTVGGSDSNSYADVDYADAYFDGRYVSPDGWAAFTTAQKNARLVAAARIIDSLKFIGKLASDTQSMSWPRNRDDVSGAFDCWSFSNLGGSLVINDRAYASNEIPTPIKQAQCELALVVFDDEGNIETGDGVTASGAKIASSTLGKWAVSFVHGLSDEFGMPSQIVVDLLMPFLDLSQDNFRG